MISIPFISSSSARSVGARSSLMRERESSLADPAAAHRNGHRDFPAGLRLASRPISLVGFSQNQSHASSATGSSSTSATGAIQLEHVSEVHREEVSENPDLDVNLGETLGALDDARETALVGSDEEPESEAMETEPLLLSGGRSSSRLGGAEREGSPARPGAGTGIGGQPHSTHTHDCKSDGCQRVSINVSGLVWETRLAILNRHPTTLFGNPIKRAKYYNSKTNGKQNPYLYPTSPLLSISMIYLSIKVYIEILCG